MVSPAAVERRPVVALAVALVVVLEVALEVTLEVAAMVVLRDPIAKIKMAPALPGPPEETGGGTGGGTGG